METLRLRLRPQSAFGSAIRGDTLFGQLCWAIRNRLGEARLIGLLEGYTEGKPFAVCSDAFPAGFFPRPALPLYRYRAVAGMDRKSVKKLRWLSEEALGLPVEEWLHKSLSDAELARQLLTDGFESGQFCQQHLQPHNTIDRQSGTTGLGEFAPYALPQYWYAPGTRLDIYIVIDPSRLAKDELSTLVSDISRSGYGRDASIGLGKFQVDDINAITWPEPDGANTCLTLAPAAIQGIGLNPKQAFYDIFTRFGRHGDRGVLEAGGPYKTPVLLAGTGALLGRMDARTLRFIGRGLGGNGEISKSIPATVQQGYAPCIAVRVDWEAA